MQNDLKHTGKNRITDPDQCADDDDGDADDTRIGDELLLRRPRDLLHLGDDFPQEFDYFSHDRDALTSSLCAACACGRTCSTC